MLQAVVFEIYLYFKFILILENILPCNLYICTSIKLFWELPDILDDIIDDNILINGVKM